MYYPELPLTPANMEQIAQRVTRRRVGADELEILILPPTKPFTMPFGEQMQQILAEAGVVQMSHLS